MKRNDVYTPSGVLAMTQFTLASWKGWSLRLHRFYAADPDGFHSHPRGFVSICLKGGYKETVWGRPALRTVRAGTITVRRAQAAHRVDPTPGTITLAFTTPIRRQWERIHPPRVVLIGKPGTGKTTQGHLLAERYGVPHISMGDRIREILGEPSHPLNGYLRKRIPSGKWQPLDCMVARKVFEYETSGLSGWVVDGFPRTTLQAAVLGGGVTSIYYHLPDEECVRRVVLRNRDDNAATNAYRRLAVEAQRLPSLIEFLHPVVIDASGTVREVFDATIKAIEV